ncbi:MAG TPA: hypothetical protein VGH03_14265 [Caulobacteraceae bacterium]|jgi:hypothetical protein
MYYALPAGCPAYPYGGYSYYHCGGAFYEPRYEGDTVVYVTVPDPTNGQASAAAPAEASSMPMPSGGPPAQPGPG